MNYKIVKLSKANLETSWKETSTARPFAEQLLQLFQGSGPSILILPFEELAGK